MAKSEYKLVSPDKLEARPTQVRQVFDTEFLNSLAESVKDDGIISPLLVRSGSNGKYEIIAGEQRWRASRIAKLKEIPVVIVDVDDKKAVELAFIENETRRQLSSKEREDAIKVMWDTANYPSFEALGKALGKNKRTIDVILSAHDVRRSDNLPDATTTAMIKATQGLDTATRKVVIEKAIEGDLPSSTDRLHAITNTLKSAPEASRAEIATAIAKQDVNLEDAKEIAETLTKVAPETASKTEVKQLVKARQHTSQKEFRQITAVRKKEAEEGKPITPITTLVRGDVRKWNSYLANAREARDSLFLLAPRELSDWPHEQRDELIALLHDVEDHIRKMLRKLEA